MSRDLLRMTSTRAIAGLLFATALTLGVVPVLYSLFCRVRFEDFRWQP